MESETHIKKYLPAKEDSIIMSVPFPAPRPSFPLIKIPQSIPPISNNPNFTKPLGQITSWNGVDHKASKLIASIFVGQRLVKE